MRVFVGIKGVYFDAHTGIWGEGRGPSTISYILTCTQTLPQTLTHSHTQTHTHTHTHTHKTNLTNITFFEKLIISRAAYHSYGLGWGSAFGRPGGGDK